MNVLSLFDGMSCGRIALERAGIKVTNYYASEIDKHAIKVTQANWPETVQLGSVVDVKTKNQMLVIPHDDGNGHQKIDLLIGGSPCQDFSFAGSQAGFNGDRGALFFEYLRLLRELKPRFFLLENVNMKQANKQAITDYLASIGYPCEPVRINSNLVSAQNRDRLYWTNIPQNGLPADKGIKLVDILEDGYTDREKSHCIDANYFKGGNLKSYFEKHRRQLVFSADGLCHVGDADLKGHAYVRRVYHPEGKSPALCANSGGNLEPKILYPASIVGRRLKDGVRKDSDKSVPLVQCLEVHGNDKSRCLTTMDKDTIVSPLPKGRYPDAYSDDMRLMWRKLTPIECERLQTVPDNYTNHVSNTQRYRMLGNGWTVDVICHLFEGLKVQQSEVA